MKALFDHILEGHDIPTPKGMLRVSIADAFLPLEPYRFAQNLQHAVLWQEFWLQKLAGGRKSSSQKEWHNDFRVPEPSEYEDLKRRFVSGLEEARRIAESGDHQLSEEEAEETLLRIAVHGAYHIGQMNLIKGQIRRMKKFGDVS